MSETTCSDYLEQSKEAIAKKYFNTWKKLCSKRATILEQALFENYESSSEESEEVDQKNVQTPANLFQHEENSEKKLWKVIIGYRMPHSFNPENDNVYFMWQFVVSIGFLYNACCIPLRGSFPYQSEDNLMTWLVCDYIADLVYVIDMVFFQVRRQFLKSGCPVEDRAAIRQYYLKSDRFKRDIISVIPTDLLYFSFGIKPMVRLNRLMKLDSYFEFNNIFENMLKQAYVFRVARTTTYLLYVIHLDACLYYYISYLNQFKSEWGYDLQGNYYIRCYFWAFMTTTTIGNVPSPVSTLEYILQLVHYITGLFVFSIVIGQVRDSVQAATTEAEEYRTRKNACLNYMQQNNISLNIQNKVRLWFEYTWNTQRILDENALLRQMPGKMHTELAINVHMDVLSKVEIFKECDKQLLYDLLLKLQPILYLPGDYVCKKGEVGREMYIITTGMVQVVGETPSQVFATLRTGTAFGEISLLAIGGGNRRTANIYSPGYTTLFILYKQDLNEVLQNYPEAQRILKKKARKFLNKDTGKKKKNSEMASSLVSSMHFRKKQTRLLDIVLNVKTTTKA